MTARDIQGTVAVLLLTIFMTMASAVMTHAYNLYFVSVGNSHYRDAALDIPDANLSARQVAVALRQAGAVDGITLNSEEAAFVTRDDVLSTVREVAERARRDDDPLLVFYFIGHGRSDGSSIGHVSITGSHDGSEVSSGLVTATDLRETLAKTKLPYVLILDNCFWRESMDFAFVSGMMSLMVPGEALVGFGSSFGESALGIGSQIESIGFGSVEKSSFLPRVELYAASEGDVVRTVPHPKSPRYAVGPLARRLLLLVDDTIARGVSIDVHQFVARMQDRTFDPQTTAGHVIATMAVRSGAFFVPKTNSGPLETGEIRIGSATER